MRENLKFIGDCFGVNYANSNLKLLFNLIFPTFPRFILQKILKDISSLALKKLDGIFLKKESPK